MQLMCSLDTSRIGLALHEQIDDESSHQCATATKSMACASISVVIMRGWELQQQMLCR